MNDSTTEKKKRKGGPGRPKGKLMQKTLDMRAALERYRERTNKIGDKLFESKAIEALGYHKMVRIEKTKNKKYEEVYTVTDPEEFDNLILNGDLGKDFILVAAAPPNYKAAESIENRAWGKPIETVEHSGIDGEPMIIKLDS